MTLKPILTSMRVYISYVHGIQMNYKRISSHIHHEWDDLTFISNNVTQYINNVRNALSALDSHNNTLL